MSEEGLYRYVIDMLYYKHHCPNCNAVYKCFCKTCDPDKKAKWASFDGERLTCLSCGKTMHYDAWMDLGVDQLHYVTKKESLSASVKLLSKCRKHEGLKTP